MLKKTCSYMVKKIMLMIVFFTISTWFCYIIISANFRKNKIKKIMYDVWKKHIYLSWKSCIIFGVLAPIYLIRKYHIFLQQKYGFLGVGFLLGRGDCSLHPHGLFQMFCCIPPLCRIFIELARLTIKKYTCY